MLNLNNPRITGREAIKETVDTEIWEQNRKFSEELKAMLAMHPLASHPLMEFFDNETVDNEKTLTIHLEFGYGFAQIFTDAVIKAMFLSSQMESRLGPKAKATARFLWALNLQDELGYFPSENGENYKGNPYEAHYFQFVKLFKELDTDIRAIESYKPTPAAIDARKSFEDTYENYKDITTILAFAESIFDEFAGPWANNVGRSTGVDVSTGYHTIHVEDHDGESIDDEHSEDSWTLFCQAVTPNDHADIKRKAKDWLDNWYRFCDSVLEIAMK